MLQEHKERMKLMEREHQKKVAELEAQISRLKGK